jgi:hypothetical protein
MVAPRRFRLHRRTIFVVLLSVALLLALSLGLRHRIAHGGPGDTFAAHAQHSCAAFDSATLGDRLASSPVVFTNLSGRAPFGCASMPANWHAPVAMPFSARAPPGLVVVIAASHAAPSQLQL